MRTTVNRYKPGSRANESRDHEDDSPTPVRWVEVKFDDGISVLVNRIFGTVTIMDERDVVLKHVAEVELRDARTGE